METKILNLHERKLDLIDTMDMESDSAIQIPSNDRRSLHAFKGHAVFCDENGNVLLEKDNTIVLRGRTFALEKIFGISSSGLGLNYNTQDLPNKKVCLFRCGTGGCIEGQPFNILPTASNCAKLSSEIPFRPVIAGESLTNYTDIRTGSDNIQYYWSKKFDSMVMDHNRSEGKTSTTEDEVYVKLTLKITEDDFATIPTTNINGDIEYKRSTFINELGLYIANEDNGNYRNYELFSRLTFESEPLFNNTKVIIIYYYIYA